LVEGYLAGERVRYDRIADEPAAGAVESLLERRLLKTEGKQACSGFFEDYAFTNKGKKLASQVIRLSEAV